MSCLLSETFYIDIKPISLNQCYRSIHRSKNVTKGFVTAIKSENYRLFEQQMEVNLALQMEKLAKIAHFYKNGENFMTCNYTFKFPRKDFITIAGNLNKRCADVDNLVKPVNDCLFRALRRYKKEMDDSCIVGIKAMKVPHEMDCHKIEIEVQLRDALDGIKIF